MIARYGFWNNRRYFLNKMTLKDLFGAYFRYYAINAYILLAVISTYVAFQFATSLWLNVLAVVLAGLFYPLAWYLLHRYVLHGRYLYKNRFTAKVWKRIHFDHHQDPHDLGVLFGALYTTLPTIFLVTAPIGWLLDGIGGAASAFAAGLVATCIYEFVHCIQHLPFKPKNKKLALMKKRHMEHHFHDESGNFGITNFFWDKFFSTYYVRSDRAKKSQTVHNLGYTPREAKKYPWVAKMSGKILTDHPRRHRNA